MDQAKSSTLTKIRIAQVIAHELAHFWFGNLVTMVGFFMKTLNVSYEWSLNLEVVDRPVAKRGFRFVHGVCVCRQKLP